MSEVLLQQKSIRIVSCLLGGSIHNFHQILTGFFQTFLELMNVLAVFTMYSPENLVHEIPNGFKAQGIFILEEVELV